MALSLGTVFLRFSDIVVCECSLHLVSEHRFIVIPSTTGGHVDVWLVAIFWRL